MNLNNYHSTVNKIINILKDQDIWFETFQHKAVTTSKEAADIRTGYTLEQGAKAMILRVKISNTNKYFAQFVIPGNEKINSKLVKKLLEAKNIRFANKEEIKEITNGIEIGGIPPFGNLFDLPVYMDKTLAIKEKIIFNAGDKSFSIGMYSKDFINIVKPQIKSFII